MAHEHVGRFRLDPEQLRRAVDNLVLNAIRHAGAGGHVTVTARNAQQGQLVIEVADDGPGVPQDQRLRIFEPFVSDSAAGSGLGLAVVREVAAAHGGQAYVADNPSGAHFRIEIPWQPYS
jgi:signal transduction histidine kinase